MNCFWSLLIDEEVVSQPLQEDHFQLGNLWMLFITSTFGVWGPSNQLWAKLYVNLPLELLNLVMREADEIRRAPRDPCAAVRPTRRQPNLLVVRCLIPRVFRRHTVREQCEHSLPPLRRLDEP